MWSLDDVLRYVPLAALYDGKHYLVEKYCTSVFTGASVPALPQQPSDWQGSSGVLLALGVTQAHTVMDPATGKSVDFPALPGVAEELKEIVRSAGNPTGALAGKPLEDGQFTQNALRLGLTVGYPVVHIASHFALGADYKSSFLLLGDGTALTLDALLGQGGQVFAGVDLLTLSACQTGEGGGDGHEFESLGALAQAQGASSVLASLWPVSDVTTPLLMRAFYTQRAGGAGITKAESLRQAQLKLLGGTISPPPSDALARAGRAAEGDDASALPVFTPDPKAPYAHPYYWAPFVLIGNWR
jgi:CHAT domain-containing protein